MPFTPLQIASTAMAVVGAIIGMLTFSQLPDLVVYKESMDPSSAWVKLKQANMPEVRYQNHVPVQAVVTVHDAEPSVEEMITGLNVTLDLQEGKMINATNASNASVITVRKFDFVGIPVEATLRAEFREAERPKVNGTQVPLPPPIPPYCLPKTVHYLLSFIRIFAAFNLCSNHVIDQANIYDAGIGIGFLAVVGSILGYKKCPRFRRFLRFIVLLQNPAQDRANAAEARVQHLIDNNNRLQKEIDERQKQVDEINKEEMNILKGQVSSLEQQLREAKDTISRFKGKNKETQEEADAVDNLKQRISDIEAERDDAINNAIHLDKEKDSLSMQQAKDAVTIQDLQSQVLDLSNSRIDDQDELDKLQESLSRAQDRARDNNAATERVRTELQEERTAGAASKKSLETVQRSLREARQKHGDEQKVSSTAKKDLEKLKEDLREEQRKFEKERAAHAKVQEDIRELVNSIDGEEQKPRGGNATAEGEKSVCEKEGEQKENKESEQDEGDEKNEKNEENRKDGEGKIEEEKKGEESEQHESEESRKNEDDRRSDGKGRAEEEKKQKEEEKLALERQMEKLKREIEDGKRALEKGPKKEEGDKSLGKPTSRPSTPRAPSSGSSKSNAGPTSSRPPSPPQWPAQPVPTGPRFPAGPGWQAWHRDGGPGGRTQGGSKPSPKAKEGSRAKDFSGPPSTSEYFARLEKRIAKAKSEDTGVGSPKEQEDGTSSEKSELPAGGKAPTSQGSGASDHQTPSRPSTPPSGSQPPKPPSKLPKPSLGEGSSKTTGPPAGDPAAGSSRRRRGRGRGSKNEPSGEGGGASDSFRQFQERLKKKQEG